jgi:hypothetical protein
MADYGLKYQSDFYNYFGKLVSVKIYRVDYELETIDIRTSEVTIQSNYTDDDTSIIGKGAKIVVIADTEDMDYLEDLLLSTEKEFLCTIEYNSQPVFKGYSICDMNERQLLPFAQVTLQFTDYMHRTDGQYPKFMKSIGQNTELYSIINEMLLATELEFNLFVNSTLFEDTMTQEANDTWLTQTYVQNSIFYSDAFTIDNIYDAINKSLKSFSAFMYSYNNKWVIERQEDITRDGTWVTYGQEVINDLASTARQFVNDHYATILAEEVVHVTALVLDPNDAHLVFTGYFDFTTPTIANATGDLAGTVNTPSQNYTTSIDAIYRLYPNNESGTVIMVCIGISRHMHYQTSQQITCSHFVSDYVSDYADVGITLTYAQDGDGWYVQLQRTGQINARVRTWLSGDFDLTIDHVQTYVAAIPKVQDIALTGVYGTANVTVNGSSNYLLGVPSTPDSDIDTVIASVTTPLKQILNKQDGDWAYVDCSQLVEYDSGLHTLILNLRDKLLDTLVFNDWPSPDAIETTDWLFPNSDSDVDLEYRTWYVNSHYDAEDISVGEDMHDISQWVRFQGDLNRMYGWNYKFAVYGNQDSESADTILTIGYKMSTDIIPSNACKVSLDVIMRIIGGPYNNAYMSFAGPIDPISTYGYDQYGISGPYGINIFPEHLVLYANTTTVFHRCRTCTLVDIGWEEKEKTWEFSVEINLEDCPVRIYNDANNYVQYDNFWGLMGSPEYQMFVITFLPARYSIRNKDDPRITDAGLGHDFATNYLGDIMVTVNAETIANKITYVINKDFIKTQEVDLYLFDLENMNYGNALLCQDGFSRTKLWASENSIVPIPLYEVLAKCKFRKYGRTIHRLKGKILSDNVLKPFALLTDDTILDEYENVITFLLNGFTWDLVNGTYDIEAEEYSEENVVVDGVEYDEEGEIVYPTPATPIWGSCWMETSGYRHPIHLSWEPVEGGMIGYKVEQYPYFVNHLGTLVDGVWTAPWGEWKDAWKQVYIGNPNSCNITQGAGATAHALSFRVCAYNPTGQSGWSSSKNYSWTP